MPNDILIFSKQLTITHYIFERSREVNLKCCYNKENKIVRLDRGVNYGYAGYLQYRPSIFIVAYVYLKYSASVIYTSVKQISKKFLNMYQSFWK